MLSNDLILSRDKEEVFGMVILVEADYFEEVQQRELEQEDPLKPR